MESDIVWEDDDEFFSNQLIEDLQAIEQKFYSSKDCCPGQNRNSVVVSMLRHALSIHPSLKVINLKFLEPGHTHMECDSMHATIETASQFATVYCPRDWLNVIKLAKKNGRPYTVKVMHLEDFWDFKALKKHAFINTTDAVDGSKLTWGCVKWIRLEKEKPDSLFFKNEFWDPTFKELNISEKPETNSKEEKPLRKRRQAKQTQPHILKPAYNKRLPLDEAKIKDLREMCRSGLIPKEYHPFYQELATIAASSPKSKNKRSNSDMEDDLSLAEMKRRCLMKRRPKKQ